MTDYTLVPLTNGTQQMSKPAGDSGEVPITAPPSSLQVTGTTSSTISLSFGRTIPPEFWVLTWEVTGSQAPASSEGAGTLTTTTISGLASLTDYTINLYAKDNGQTSTPLTVTAKTTTSTAVGDLYMECGRKEDDQKDLLTKAIFQHSWSTWSNELLFAEDPQQNMFLWTGLPKRAGNWQLGRAGGYRMYTDFYALKSKLPSAGLAYLTIRYKDTVRTPCRVLYGRSDEIGTIGGANDSVWKTKQFTIDIAKCITIDSSSLPYGDYWAFRVGSSFSDDNDGQLTLDRIKIDMSPLTPEFPADAQGMKRPRPAPENDRFAQVGTTNEYVLGEGPFFPLGGYLRCPRTYVSADAGPGTVGTAPKDQFNVYEDAGINTLCIHGWDTNWYSYWRDTTEQSSGSVWTPDGTRRVEMGLEEYLFHMGERGIKAIPNTLTDIWPNRIEKDGDFQDTLERLSDIIEHWAGDPRILCWKMVDEIEHQGKTKDGRPPMAPHQLHTMMKTADPNKANMTTFMGFMLDDAWHEWGDATDIIAPDNYWTDYRGEKPYGGKPTLLQGHQRQLTWIDNTRKLTPGRGNWVVGAGIQSTFKNIHGFYSTAAVVLSGGNLTTSKWTFSASRQTPPMGPGVITCDMHRQYIYVSHTDAAGADQSGNLPGATGALEMLSDLDPDLRWQFDIVSVSNQSDHTVYEVWQTNNKGASGAMAGINRANNMAETLCQIYAAICHGATGAIFFWLEHPDIYTVAEDAYGHYEGLKEASRQLLTENGGVGQYCMAPNVPLEFNGEQGIVTITNPLEACNPSPKPQDENLQPFHSALFQAPNGAKILFVANLGELPYTPTIAVTGITDGVKTLPIESHTVTVSGGQFTDKFHHMQAHVYFIEGTP